VHKIQDDSLGDACLLVCMSFFNAVIDYDEECDVGVVVALDVAFVESLSETIDIIGVNLSSVRLGAIVFILSTSYLLVKQSSLL